MRTDSRWYGGRHTTNRRDLSDRAMPRQPTATARPVALRADDEATDRHYRALRDEHRAHLVAYAMRLTDGDAGYAEDLVTEALHRAWRDPATLDRRCAVLRPWLTVLTREVFLGRQRPEAALPPVRDGRGAAASSTVLGALRALSGPHRAVIVDLFHRGLSLEEAAREHGVPVAAVKSRLYHAMRALRVVLEQSTV